jgi:carbonic anhydrase
MRTLENLFKNNRQWAAAMERQQPGFFVGLARQQTPEYLWIGCSDSRVPANEIVGLRPGELFVHRNIANLVAHTDCNCMSVIQYAIEVLKVRHIIVCGHYGCGGVAAAMSGASGGLIGTWLGPLRAICNEHGGALGAIDDPDERFRRCCEINVAEQVRRVCDSLFVQNAWRQKLELSVHGWIYDVADGLLRDLGLSVGSHEEVASWRD